MEKEFELVNLFKSSISCVVAQGRGNVVVFPVHVRDPKHLDIPRFFFV